MTSDLIDMSIICVSAAKSFTENNPSFIVYAPIAMNTDVFFVKEDNPILFGITQNRSYQETLVRENYGSEVKLMPMIGPAIPYALEKNELQAAVVDVTKAMQLNGSIISSAINKDTVTYVLIVNKTFVQTQEFKDFVTRFNNATEMLKEDEELYNAHLAEYVGVENIEKGVHKKWKVKLLSIEEN
jgi:hypothetical protein